MAPSKEESLKISDISDTIFRENADDTASTDFRLYQTLENTFSDTIVEIYHSLVTPTPAFLNYWAFLNTNARIVIDGKKVILLYPKKQVAVKAKIAFKNL